MRADALRIFGTDPHHHERVVEEYAELSARWRAAFPAAAKERSAALKPLMREARYLKQAAHEPEEIWFNDVYYVTVRRHQSDPVFGTGGGMVQLGISTLDQTVRHDWREYQSIKNQLAGPECEGFELYPAESRLVDPSNYFMLWCFPGLRRLKVGANTREVFDANQAIAPQRAFAARREGASLPQDSESRGSGARRFG